MEELLQQMRELATMLENTNRRLKENYVVGNSEEANKARNIWFSIHIETDRIKDILK